jgi:superfamily II DNA or RNA helicase
MPPYLAEFGPDLPQATRLAIERHVQQATIILEQRVLAAAHAARAAEKREREAQARAEAKAAKAAKASAGSRKAPRPAVSSSHSSSSGGAETGASTPAPMGVTPGTGAAGARARSGAPAPHGPPPPIVRVPVDGPAGATTHIAVPSLAGLLARLVAGSDSVAALDLACAAAQARTTESFDRLLALETVRGVDHLPHQIETVLRTLKRFHGRVLLADEVGLGKTIEASLVLAEYLARSLVRRALVLCPPALVAQWRSELAEKFGVTARTTLDTELSRDPRAFFGAEGVIIASLALARSERYRETVLAQRFDLVIVDEAHHLKNRSTRGHALVDALRSRFLLLLTATPVETNLAELYNLVTLLRPGTLGTESEFRARFADPKDPTRPRDAGRLRELLREVMIRNTRAQSGVALPPRTARTLVVEPSAEERILYDAIVALVRAATSRPSLFRLLLEQGGSSPAAVARTAGTAEVPELTAALREVAALATQVRRWTKVERLLELLPGGKVLVFTRFLATHAALAEGLARRGVRFVPFTGSMSAVQREEAVRAFAGDADVLLCSEVGGEGQNLQFCHRIVNFDLPWSPTQIEQRIGRVHRIGQTEVVEVTNLCTGGTAEEHILRVLDERINLFELVVGEMDLLLGELEDERPFEDRIHDIYARTRTDADVAEGFEALGQALAFARDRMAAVRETDAAIFGDELGV